jgi:membrane fusion protein, heavy metal efflux system
MKNLPYLLPMLLFITSCGNAIKKKEEKNTTPIISNNGQSIFFSDIKTLSFFKTESVDNNPIHTEFAAIGTVGATILKSYTGTLQNIVLFENPELAEHYSQFVQHQINISQIRNVNIKQKQIELERIKDLQSHGVATGQDLLNAQMALSIEKTSLANEQVALVVNETKLKSAGFRPEILRSTKAGTAYVICNIPENQIEKIQQGSTSYILFTAFPNELYTGKIEGIADMVDDITRMVKIRIRLNNSSNKIKTGMFANILFKLNSHTSGEWKTSLISINKNSLVTVQGKNYVFVKKSINRFERKEVNIGQQIGDRLLVFSGLNNKDEIAIEGVIQLKGLSFGY